MMSADSAMATRAHDLGLQWPTAFPRPRGLWTLRGRDGWATYDPESGAVRLVDPADDPRLPALRGALERGTLVGYRAGRRAVVATSQSFVKVVRPDRLAALIATHDWFDQQPSTGETPSVLAVDPNGSLDLKPIRGRALHRLLRDDLPAAMLGVVLHDVAQRLAMFHTTPAPPRSAARRLDPPQRWIDTVGRADAAAVSELVAVAGRLPPLDERACALTHGDLHDKNVFHSSRGVGMIDLDSVALGAPEDDVANLAVHLRLRALQAGEGNAVGRDRARRFVAAYHHERPLCADRLQASAAHTWFRLACIYRFRRSSRHLVPQLLRLAVDDR